jgi:hypothetical protein
MLAMAISPRVRVPMSMVTEQDNGKWCLSGWVLQSVVTYSQKSVLLIYSYERPSDDLQTISI